MSQSLSPARLNPALIDRRPTTARGWGVGGIVIAVLLHVLVIGATLMSFAHKIELADDSPPVVPVDLVTIADKTNVAPTFDRTVKPTPKEDVKPPAPVTPPAPTPTPPPPAAAEVAPAPPTPKPVELKPAPKPEPLKPAPAPKPEAKPQAKPAPDKPKKTALDSADALLNNILAAPTPATPHKARPSDRNRQGIGDMSAMNVELAQALRNAIIPCWSPPAGAPNPERYIPYFRIFLNRDGTVAQPPQLQADSAAQAASDPFMRAAVEAARRAIYTCAPYKLPADKYSSWGDFTIDFDPRKMIQ